MRRSILVACISSALALLAAARAGADVTSDKAAAILIFPRVLALESQVVSVPQSISRDVDTVIQISNTSNEAAHLHCFYVNALGHCSVSGVACGATDSGLGCPLAEDVCLPGWTESDFDVVLTPRQPLAWRASVGLSRDLLPLGGGQSGGGNSGTLIPPVGLEEGASRPPVATLRVWQGELKCVVVDETRHGIARNVIKGEATVIQQTTAIVPSLDAVSNQPRVEKYNAIGIQAIEGDANRDGILELGGDANEYNGCSNVLIAEHWFDFGGSPARDGIISELTLVPCTQDLRTQTPGTTTAQFLVFNEFEQRFSTSQRVDCFFKRQLSHIDTNNATRSIFSAFVAGTLAGQTRIRGVQTGLLGVLSETVEEELLFAADASHQLGLQGERPTADQIVLP